MQFEYSGSSIRVISSTKDSQLTHSMQRLVLVSPIPSSQNVRSNTGTSITEGINSWARVRNEEEFALVHH